MAKVGPCAVDVVSQAKGESEGEREVDVERSTTWPLNVSRSNA